jgi:sterol desaturase/sphingolipid hydroxylase (fatty acid hydroxylase superfamily)
MKQFVFRYLQPATVGALLLFWASAPAAALQNPWFQLVMSLLILGFVQTLEWLHERHAGWRLNRREFLTDLFYVAVYYTVIVKLNSMLVDEPLGAAKAALGISTPWVMKLPFVAQVAFALFVIELGQYWLHRLMHHTFLWWTHAPHHHVTQLNALKGLVGNPLELLLVSMGALALFDLPLNAMLCTFNILLVVSSFAHANVRFDPPAWYGYVFTTVEAHSLHHRVGFEDTRCNYANTLILLDHLFGTHRAGESAVVGQDERRRLTIREQWLFPLRPLGAWWRRRTLSAAD